MNPTLILKFIGSSIGIGGGITGSIFSSFQAFTRITIEDLLKDDLFSGEEEDEWKILKKKLDESKNTDDKKLKLTKLEGIKETKGEENWEKIKNWCSTKKSFQIKKFLPSSFESLLLSYIKDFCILTIGEKLTPSKQFTVWTETDKSKLTTNAGKLDNHSNTNGDLSKEPKLSEIKSKSTKDNEKEKALLNWCKETYKKTYKGENDNLWKLADYYCKKTQ